MADVKDILDIEDGLKVQSNEVGQCPCCNSCNVSYGNLEAENGLVYYEVTCDECGVSYREWYSLEFVSNDNIK